MTLRTRLMLAQGPLVIALALVAVVSLFTITTLGQSAQRILRDNYRSVLAAQTIKSSLERIDSAMALVVMGRTTEARRELNQHQRVVTAELAAAGANITEPGETEAIRVLGDLWSQYQSDCDRFLGSSTPTATYYVDTLAPACARARVAAQHILDLNQDAMVHRSLAADRTSQLLTRLTVIVSLVALALGLRVGSRLVDRMLRPLESLEQAARRIGEGDLESRAAVVGHDEITQLAREFNGMAERLSEVSRGAMGRLIHAQRASQSAIDSIPYPVLVFDISGSSGPAGVHPPIRGVESGPPEPSAILKEGGSLRPPRPPASGSLVAINQAGLAMLSLTRLEPGLDPLALVEPGVRSVVEAARTHVFAGKGPLVPRGFQDAISVAFPGGARHLLPRAAPIYGDLGSVQGATVVLQDVTRLRRFDELKNDLVATVAHELRTPLTSLHMAIHLCADSKAGPLTETQADLLWAARNDCERLQTIIDELLDLARLQEGKTPLKLVPTLVTDLVADCLSSHSGLAANKNIKLIPEVLEPSPLIRADPESLGRALANLVSNAVRYSPPGGRVTFRASRIADHQVRLEVIDEGPGIAQEHQARVFDRFFRIPSRDDGRPDAPAGTGLGLAIAREIVERHGGKIGVESLPGHGASFWIEIPQCEETPV